MVACSIICLVDQRIWRLSLVLGAGHVGWRRIVLVLHLVLCWWHSSGCVGQQLGFPLGAGVRGILDGPYDLW